ncbi:MULTISPECIES: cold shock domain-containing protein [Clostridium]
MLVHFSNIQMNEFKKLEIGEVVKYYIGEYY